MSATNDRTGLREPALWELIVERDRIARQTHSLGEAIRAMRDVREQMHDRLIAIMGELQWREALGTDTHDGEAK